MPWPIFAINLGEDAPYMLSILHSLALHKLDVHAQS